MSLDLTGANSFVRKTDETLRVTLVNGDSSNFIAGDYVFYLTVRKNVPPTSIEDDNDTNVVIKKTVTVTLASPDPEVVCDFTLTQTDLDIDPRNYYYDVKVNDTFNFTTSITGGFKLFSVVADITRRNI